MAFLGATPVTVKSTTPAQIGAQYEADFYTRGQVDADTVSDVKAYLKGRPGIRGVNASRVGSIIKATFTATAGRTLGNLAGTVIVAGSSNSAWQAYQWLQLVPAGKSSSVLSYLNPVTNFKRGYTAGKKIEAAVNEKVAGGLPKVGGTIGNTLAAAIKPLFGYAIVGAAVYGVITGQQRKAKK